MNYNRGREDRSLWTLKITKRRGGNCLVSNFWGYTTSKNLIRRRKI